jgi:hypothetical protein
MALFVSGLLVAFSDSEVLALKSSPLEMLVKAFATAGGAFAALWQGSVFDPNLTRNGYWNGFDYDANGTLHKTWTYRESSAGYANHDINYASSTDGGFTWKNNAGAAIAASANNGGSAVV